jgi:hypothetical protein
VGEVTIETKYDIGQTLYIPAAGNLQCRVLSVKLTGRNLTYMVEYWSDLDIKTAELYEDELTNTPKLKEITMGKNIVLDGE